MSKQNNKANNALQHKRQPKDKQIVLDFIVSEVVKGTKLSFQELKKQYSEDKLFQIGLKYVTTTKKAFCTALKIPVEAGCRYKRTLEKEGLLKQSTDSVICPYTKHSANLISTNPSEFERLEKSKSTQLKLSL